MCYVQMTCCLKKEKKKKRPVSFYMNSNIVLNLLTVTTGTHVVWNA